MTNNICKQTDNVTAFIQNELDAKEHARFSEHLKQCPACQERLSDYEKIVKRLKDAPDAKPRTDITARVMDHINAQPKRRVKPWGWIAAAAGIIIMLGAGLIIMHQRPIGQEQPIEHVRIAQAPVTITPEPEIARTPPEVIQALDWLALNQDKDGKWPIEKWQGNRQFEIAGSALSVMALAGVKQEQRTQYMPNIQKGIDYLLKQQSPQGRFGPASSVALYNHGIATVCLLEMYALLDDNKLETPIKSAIKYIERSQRSSGGWGYMDIADDAPNTAVTCWALQALLWTDALELGEVKLNLKKGFEWLAGVSDELGRPGYRAAGEFPYGPETLSVMAAFCYTYGGAKYLPNTAKYKRLMDVIYQGLLASEETDYYRDYFLVYLDHPSLDKMYADLVKDLNRKQANNDTLAGTWAATDQWGEVGGRVYSTALAALTLEANTRGPRLRNYLKD